ncbi:MAG: hypothetical protein IPP72_15305 [Chitinophagaceae bacterium]|nr:hypothetical protein [Chitinophagaceae bacterium]
MPIDLIDIITSPFTPTVYIYKNRQLTGITTDATGNIFITVNWQEPLGNSAFIRPGAKHYNVYKQTPGGTFSELYFGDHFGYGLGIDGTGNLYVAAAEGVSPCVTNGGGIGPCFDGTPEYYDTRHIRKITPGSGSSIIAGKRLTGVLIGVGPFGYTGDGGPAVDAQLKPIDVKVDAAGNVYIADGYGYGFGNGAEYGNYAIRKINTAGVITTIAGTGVNTYSGDGGPASLAAMRTPVAMAVDLSGNIYVADVKENESPLTAGNRIRKIIADQRWYCHEQQRQYILLTGEKTIYKECDTIAKWYPFLRLFQQGCNC